MTETPDRLPWYLNFTNWFIGAGVVGALVVGWFALGQPGVPPEDGDYSCLQLSSFEARERSGQGGLGYIYDPREDQYGVTLSDGSITEARVYLGSTDITANVDPQSASSYSFGTKKSPTTFTATINGTSVGCYQD